MDAVAAFKMPTKYCSWGKCKSDSKYSSKVHLTDVFFLLVPNPLEDPDKHRRWWQLCGRSPNTRKNPANGDRWRKFICSKHFVGGSGPTETDPDPVQYIAEGQCKVGLSAPQAQETDDSASVAAAQPGDTASAATSNENTKHLPQEGGQENPPKRQRKALAQDEPEQASPDTASPVTASSQSIRTRSSNKDVCCVESCSKQQDERFSLSQAARKTFFTLPREDSRCRQWVKNCGRLEWINNSSIHLRSQGIKVCSDHFTDTQYTYVACPIKRLTPDAVPTVFEGVSTEGAGDGQTATIVQPDIEVKPTDAILVSSESEHKDIDSQHIGHESQYVSPVPENTGPEPLVIKSEPPVFFDDPREGSSSVSHTHEDQSGLAHCLTQFFDYFTGTPSSIKNEPVDTLSSDTSMPSFAEMERFIKQEPDDSGDEY